MTKREKERHMIYDREIASQVGRALCSLLSDRHRRRPCFHCNRWAGYSTFAQPVTPANAFVLSVAGSSTALPPLPRSKRICATQWVSVIWTRLYDRSNIAWSKRALQGSPSPSSNLSCSQCLAPSSSRLSLVVNLSVGLVSVLIAIFTSLLKSKLTPAATAQLSNFLSQLLSNPNHWSCVWECMCVCFSFLHPFEWIMFFPRSAEREREHSSRSAQQRTKTLAKKVVWVVEYWIPWFIVFTQRHCDKVVKRKLQVITRSRC